MAPDHIRLSVQFSEGVTKLYDAKPLFEKISAFRHLNDNPVEFDRVSVEAMEREYGAAAR